MVTDLTVRIWDVGPHVELSTSVILISHCVWCFSNNQHYRALPGGGCCGSENETAADEPNQGFGTHLSHLLSSLQVSEHGL